MSSSELSEGSINNAHDMDARTPPILGAARQLSRTPVAVFAVLVAILLALLVGLDINGSSVATLTPNYGSDPSTLVGTPRQIRGDEATIETPLAVSSARQGFPDHQFVGLTLTDQQAVAHGAPSRSAFEVFKPQDWGYLVLGPSRGLAFHWWMPFALCLAGMAALFRALDVRSEMAIVLAIVATFTPYAAWWSAPTPALIIGYGALVGAGVLAAVRAKSSRTALLAAAGAGFAATAFVLTLYPPWQICVALVITGLVVGEIVARRPSRRRLFTTSAGLVAVAVPSLIAWWWSGRDAIRATMSTIYPGHRTSSAGEANLSWLVDAPLNPLLARGRGDSVGTFWSSQGFVNLSELSSSWFPIPLLIAIVVVSAIRYWRASRRREASSVPKGEGDAAEPTAWSPALVGVTVAMCLLTAWALLPLPDWTGALLLERVPSSRVSIGLGLGTMLMIGLVARDWGGLSRRDRRTEVAVWAIAVTLTVAMTVWSAAVLPWNSQGALGRGLLLGAIVALCFAAIATGVGRRTGGIALAMFAVASWALVNPVVMGLGPLESHPLTNRMHLIAEDEPGVLVEVFGDLRTNSLVRAAGVQTLSGVTFYPDEELMERLAPDQRDLWNNYVQYEWKAVAGEPAVTIRPISGSHKELQIDPCSANALDLGGEWVVSTTFLKMPCLVLVDEIPADTTTWLYRIDRP